MRTISSNTAKQTFGRVLAVAQLEPVLIEKHKHPAAVILSVAEYDRLKLSGGQGSLAAPKSSEAGRGVAKSLPVIPARAGAPVASLSAQEMIDLVHEAESDLDA